MYNPNFQAFIWLLKVLLNILSTGTETLGIWHGTVYMLNVLVWYIVLTIWYTHVFYIYDIELFAWTLGLLSMDLLWTSYSAAVSSLTGTKQEGIVHSMTCNPAGCLLHWKSSAALRIIWIACYNCKFFVHNYILARWTFQCSWQVAICQTVVFVMHLSLKKAKTIDYMQMCKLKLPYIGAARHAL